jgi:eukaryotic-like serine/threonine-protein kinase
MCGYTPRVQLGRYTVLGKLATGGMAEVFLARLDGTSGFERHVVIKRVLPQYVGQGDFSRLFQQEARFASFLAHPHIAQVSDFGVDATGAAYLVMEHVEGASLRQLLTAAAVQNERPDTRLVCRIFSQVAEALAAVHSATDPATKGPLGLIHRDVSPENVLLSRQGAVKLADFGIARAMSEASTTNPDVVRGKLRYLAPEQILGGPLSPAVDVWAFGVSLYEALALRRPFPEENEGQTTYAIAHGEVIPLERLRGDLSFELLNIVARCLSPDPEKRYPDCQDLALELERVASAGDGSVTTRIIGNWVERLCPRESARPLLPLPVELVVPAPVVAPQQPVHPPRSTPPDLGTALSTPLAIQPTLTPEPASEVAAAPSRVMPMLIAAVVALVALAVGGYWFARQVVVTSTPTGAVVVTGNRELGTTPWAGDLPLSAVDVEVRAPGYAPMKKTLGPDDPPSLNVTLKRR